VKHTEQKDGDQFRHRVVGSAVIGAELAELVYQPAGATTGFAVWSGESVRYENQVALGNGRLLVPYSPENNLIKHKVVLFPSDAAEYGSEETLVADIQAFIHRYVDLNPLFEKIASYYVLFTWVYDAFNELPYLRFRGDYGSGKSRALLTVGSLCYKPIFASGASTISPIFRLLDTFRGTLVVDEGDFRVTDEKADLVKILNNGNACGFPVLRSEAYGNRKEFDPVAYNVFGPKLLGSRGFFQDRALESRFLTEEMGHTKLRGDIPINLPASHETEAREIRNKLLLFRFRMLTKVHIDETLVDGRLEPRLNQVLLPLMSVIRDPKARGELKALARQYQREITADRGTDVEGKVLEVIHELRSGEDAETGLSISAITSAFAERYAEDFERKITAHWIGYVIRKKLGLKTERRRDGYAIATAEVSKLDGFFEKYGIVDVNLVNSVNSTGAEAGAEPQRLGHS
jgi:hypothetical protein